MPGDCSRYFSAGGRDAEKILRSVVIGNEVNELAVRREARRPRHAVEGQREHFGFTTSGWRNRNVVGGIDKKLRIKLGDVGDRLAIGGPGGRAIRTDIRGDLRQVRALV